MSLPLWAVHKSSVAAQILCYQWREILSKHLCVYVWASILSDADGRFWDTCLPKDKTSRYQRGGKVCFTGPIWADVSAQSRQHGTDTSVHNTQWRLCNIYPYLCLYLHMNIYVYLVCVCVCKWGKKLFVIFERTWLWAKNTIETDMYCTYTHAHNG